MNTLKVIHKPEDNEYDRLLSVLKQYDSIEWVNQYFDLVKELLTKLNLNNEDARLSITLPKANDINLNIGQRYIIQPLPKQYIRMITPNHFDERSVNGTLIGYFTRGKQRDAKWLECRYPINSTLPDALYAACLEECDNILRKIKRSGYRKFHSGLVYTLIMGTTAERNEVLSEAFARN